MVYLFFDCKTTSNHTFLSLSPFKTFLWRYLYFFVLWILIANKNSFLLHYSGVLEYTGKILDNRKNWKVSFKWQWDEHHISLNEHPAQLYYNTVSGLTPKLKVSLNSTKSWKNVCSVRTDSCFVPVSSRTRRRSQDNSRFEFYI